MDLFYLMGRSCSEKVCTSLQVLDTFSNLMYTVIVISIYSKSGGKNGKHCWVSDSSSISANSYVPVQVFEHMHSQQFRAVHQALQYLQVKRFTLLPAHSFLCTLDTAPQAIMANLKVSAKDYERFQILHRHAQKIVSAIKDINSRPRRQAAVVEDSDDE